MIMKIKRKVQMNLPQLIEYAWNNDVRGKRFETITQEGPPGLVYVTDGRGISIDRPVFEDELFTVEIEEEITEHTIIPKMLVIGRFDGYEEVYNRKISHYNQNLLSAYLIDDDGRMELIYDEEKGMVE